MQQTKLVIASVLKPVNDTRMYEKFALTISQAKKYEINIIGFYTKNLVKHDNINFYPIFNFNRLSFKRLFSSISYLRKLISINPKVVIIMTHELLLPSVLYKILYGGKLFYDIRENYFLNIKHTYAFPILVRQVIALWVRLKELMCTPFINHFFLAEKVYIKELHFTKNKRSIIQNKASRYISKVTLGKDFKNEELRLIFSGTLADSTGVFQAIRLHQNLLDFFPKCQLKIIGFCPDHNTYFRLQKEVNSSVQTQLIGGDKLVDHEIIINEISTSDFGIIYYPKNRANNHSIPTKLYEYVAAQLPIITEPKSQFIELLDHYPAAIYHDFNGQNIDVVANQISSKEFYKIKPKSEVLWEGEALQLLKVLNS